MQKLIKNEYSYVRGMNYIPSYATFLRDITDKFDPETWNRELGYAQRLGLNTLRIWFDIDSHMQDENRFLYNFQSMLSAISAHGMKAIPVLYNCWCDREHPFGGMSPLDMYYAKPERHRRYLRSVITAFAHDPVILMWDLCNEPYYFGFGEETRGMETAFWLRAIDFARALSPSQPLTLGTHSSVEKTPEEVYRALDVLSCHCYVGWEIDAFAETLNPHVEHANALGKALLCTETFQGSLSDETRALCIRRCKAAFLNAGVGYLGFQLMAGKMISARRDWTDSNCAPDDSGYFPFVYLDGRIRPGHENP